MTKVIRVNIVFIVIFATFTKTVQGSKRFDIVQNVLEGLQHEAWGEDETACVRDTEALLHGVRNNTLWATWAWDSMQFPVGTLYGSVYHFGNFDQCLQVPWSLRPGLQTQYCLVDVTLAPLNEYDGEDVNPYEDSERYIGAKFRNGKRLNKIFLGVCLPASCKTDSVAKISAAIFRLSHLPFENLFVDPRDCQVGASPAKPREFYVFWFIILAVALICILVYFLPNTRKKSDSAVSKILHCFCLTRNFDSLTKVSKDEIKVLHGIRAITCGVLVVAHCFFMIQFVGVINKTSAEKAFTSNPLRFTLHLDMCVDGFFVMSGLLYTRGLLASKSHQPLRTLLKRYIRLLVPLYALSIIGITYVMPHIGSGPAWPRLIGAMHQPCAKSWWRNFLMITNEVDNEGHCSDTSWYIHCDFQLTVVGTAIFILYLKSKNTACILCGLAYVTTIVVPTMWNYRQGLPALLLYDFRECFDMTTNKVYNTVYKPVYTRGSAYLIGMAMGYLMSVYKPQHYRRTISKTISILGFIVGLSLIVWIMHKGLEMFKREFSGLALAFLAAFDKTVWSVGVCIIIAVCEYGTLPIVNDFLSSKVFVPLSKLSYSSYLLHTVFIYREAFSLRVPVKYDAFEMIAHGLGYMVMSYSASYLIWLFIEAPATNLINLTFDVNRNIDKRTSEIQIHKEVNGNLKKIL